MTLYSDYHLKQDISDVYTTISGISGLTTWSGVVSYGDSYPKTLFSLPANTFIHRVGFFTDVAPSGIYYGPTNSPGNDVGQGNTSIIVGVRIPNSSVVTKIGFYSEGAAVVKLKLAHSEGSADTSFIVEDLQTVSHTGTGWEWFTLTIPKKIPSDRFWYPAFWMVSGSMVKNFITGATVDRNGTTSDQVGTVSTSASSGHRFFRVVVVPSLSVTASGVTGDVVEGIHLVSTGPAYIKNGDLIESVLSKTSSTPIYLNSLLTPMASGVGTIYVDYGPQNYVSSIGTVLTGTQANRPSITQNGALYKPTDGYYDSIYNGTGWDTYVDGFKCSNPPLVTTFSGINSASNVLTNESDGLLYQHNGNGSGGNKFFASVVAIPASGPYTLTVGMDITYLLSGESLGICITDGTGSTAKMVILDIYNSSGTLYMYGQYDTCPGTWNSTPLNINLPFYLYYRRLFLRIYDDRTTNLTLSYNHQYRLGAYTVLGTLGRTAWLTPAYIGLGGAENITLTNGVIGSQMKIFHWSLG
jgi:hypothetical protein